jgi:predicted RecB family nuclease
MIGRPRSTRSTRVCCRFHRDEAGGASYVYHYATYEETALKRLAMVHGTRETQLDDLLRRRKLVDLYKVVREGVRISEPRYSIKNLEVFYGGIESKRLYQETRLSSGSSCPDEAKDYRRWGRAS